MTDREPEPNNPLGPYYPSDLPDIPGNGRVWFALLIAGLFLLWAVSQLLALLSG